MNTKHKEDWNPNLNLDSAANAGVLATGLFVVLFAVATAETDPAPQATQVVHQDRDGRIVVTATRLKAGTATAGAQPSERNRLLQIAASTPEVPSHFNQQNLSGDDHAK